MFPILLVGVGGEAEFLCSRPTSVVWIRLVRFCNVGGDASVQGSLAPRDGERGHMFSVNR